MVEAMITKMTVRVKVTVIREKMKEHLHAVDFSFRIVLFFVLGLQGLYKHMHAMQLACGDIYL